MDILYALIGLVLIALIAIYLKLGFILIQLQDDQKSRYVYDSNNFGHLGDALKTQNEILQQISFSIEEIRQEVHEIGQVSSVFYKYRLPDKSERDMLDQIKLDNEVFGRIGRAIDEAQKARESD